LILPSQYYEENLYPLQDGVLNIISQSGTDFFLTGGTALSRAYYHHRYSDDLDFFLNNCTTFDEQLDAIIRKLSESGYNWSDHKDYIRNKDFASIKVKKGNEEVLLKIDFVNDLVPHFGEIQKTDFFYRTDSIRNMLSNKLSAIFRFAAKDVADIREICLHESINWDQIINEAREKEAGLEIPTVCDILTGMPEKEFNTIQWVKKPLWSEFKKDIGNIVFTMMCVEQG
jgi:predicted nucleotidyltransferase component of viral defense system